MLQRLAMAGNPIERDWYVMHLASRQLPQVAAAFEQFLVSRGQAQIQRQLAASGRAQRSRRRKDMKTL